MKKGIVIRAFSGNPDFLGDAGFLNGPDDFSRCFDAAVEAGFEAVQLYVEREGYLSLASDLKVAEDIAARAASAGVALASLEIAPFQYSFTDPDPEVREDAKRVVCRALEIAATMGMPGVLVIPGYVGLPWDPSVEPIPYDQAYERTRDDSRRSRRTRSVSASSSWSRTYGTGSSLALWRCVRSSTRSAVHRWERSWILGTSCSSGILSSGFASSATECGRCT